MAIVSLYKDKVYHFSQTESFEDENGDWHEGEGVWITPPVLCDAAPNGKADSISLDDGTTHVYSYTIYTKPGIEPFKVGDRLLLEKYLGNTEEFKVLGFHAYQHQCKIWV